MANTLTKAMRISPAEAHEKMTTSGYVYVDVRDKVDFDEGHPQGALHVPLDADFLAAMNGKFSKEARIIVGCATGKRSLAAAELLVADGFVNVWDQRAGFRGSRGPFGELLEAGWARAGLPVSQSPCESGESTE